MAKSHPCEVAHSRSQTSDKEVSLTFRESLRIKCRSTARRLYWNEYDKSGYECPGCGYDGDYIEVHHRDGDCLNNHPLNLVGLCYQCHKRAHRLTATADGLEQWKDKIESLGQQ